MNKVLIVEDDELIAELERDYPEYSVFVERYSIPEEMYEDLTRLGLEQGVTPPSVGSEAEMSTKRILTALVAERLFDRGAFLRMQHVRDDADFSRALEILKNWEMQGVPILEP